MAIKNTGLNVAGLRSEFFDRFSEAEMATIYRIVSTRIPSTKTTENYKWLGSTPGMREFGTGRIAKGIRSESYDVENLKYESTIEVDRDEIADDQTGQIRVRIQEMAGRAARHKDNLISVLLANGASAGYLAYDGLPFFSAAHVSGSSGDQSNDLTVNVVDANDPTSDEMKGAVREAVSAIMGFKDDQGEPTAPESSGLMVITPTDLFFPAREAMNAVIINDTTNVDAGLADVRAFPWLTSATEFYVGKVNGHVGPFIFQDREPLEFDALEEGTDESFRREKFLYGVRARYRMTYGEWRYMVKVTLNTA